MSTIVSIVLAAVIQILGIKAQEKANDYSVSNKNTESERIATVKEEDSINFDYTYKFIKIKNRTVNHSETKRKK